MKNMITDSDYKESRAEDPVHKIVVLAIAQRIFSGLLCTEDIQTIENYKDLIESIGKTLDDPFEIYMDNVAEQMDIVRLCLGNNASRAATILLFALMESEINQAIRLVMRIRGFRHNRITETLKDLNVKTKLYVILPLLDVIIEDELESVILELVALRNSSTHCKANPCLESDAESKDDDYSVSAVRSDNFFRRTDLAVLATRLDRLHLAAVGACPAIYEAMELVERFKDRMRRAGGKRH